MTRKAVCAVAALALAVAACSPGPEVQMVGSPGVAAAIGTANVAVNTPVSIGSMELCLTAPGRATITSIAMHQPTGDIAVEAFATRPNPFARGLDGVGNARSAIADLHLDLDPTATAVVAGTCPADVDAMSDTESAGFVELVAQVVRRSGADAGATALDLTYEVGGQTRTSVIPLGIWLCEATCPPEASTLHKP